MTELDRLVATEAIRVLKARYFRGLDTRDWELLGSVFAEDGIFDTRGAMGNAVPDEGSSDPFKDAGYLVGRAAIMAALSSMGATTSVMVHHGHMEEIEILGPETARAIWAMDDRVEWPEGAGPMRSLRGFGHYHDEFIRRDGVWLISFSKLTRLHVRAH